MFFETYRDIGHIGLSSTHSRVGIVLHLPRVAPEVIVVQPTPGFI